MPRKMPTKPGFYWAKKHEEAKEWDTIVLIEGDAPFLTFKAWNFNRSDIGVELGSCPNRYTFGPKIREAKRNE